MALTVDVESRLKASNININVVDVTFDSSYPTGGEELLPQTIGLTRIVAVIPTDGGGYMFEYDHANKKLKALHCDYDAVADGPMVEVPDTTDLSAVSVKLIVLGY